jgi:hypothetical protein
MSRLELVSRCALACLTCLAACVADSTSLGKSPPVRQRPATASRAYYGGGEQRYRGAAVNTQYEMEGPVDGGYVDGYGDRNCDGGCESCGPDCEGYCDGGCDSCYCGGGGCYDGGCGSCGGGCGDGVMCGQGCCADYGCVPNLCPQKRFMIFGDYLYLRVVGADVAHAQQQDGTTPPPNAPPGAGVAPYGDIGTVDIEHHPGFRVGGGIACGPCSSVMFSYSFFESDGFNSLELPNITGGTGAVGSLVHHPGAAINASSGPVDVTYDVDFQLADLVYTGTLSRGNRHTVDYLVGAQAGHLDQDFVQFGRLSGGQGAAIDTSTTIDFDGGGLKAGLVGDGRLGGGLSTYGRLTAAVMSGRFSSDYLMFDTTNVRTLAEAHWKDNRVVPQLEYEAGFAWLSSNECLRFSTGYMFSHWMNAVTTSEFIESVQENDYVDVGDTITFDGLVTRIEVLW